MERIDWMHVLGLTKLLAPENNRSLSLSNFIKDYMLALEQWVNVRLATLTTVFLAYAVWIQT